jgi:hypothetical protein
MDDSWLCGFCGQPTWKFRQGELAHEAYQAVMAWHAYEAHEVDMGMIDRAQGDGRTWVLPDGRVWLRQG